MAQFQKISLFLLRITLGWFMFYAGITKVTNSTWSAAGYLNGAQSFGNFYHWLAGPSILPAVNLVNEWGLTLLGISLILGIGVRLSSLLGALLMLLYRLPLGVLHPDAHSFIVDDHLIYLLILLLFADLRMGRVWGLENWFARLPVISKIPGLRSWFG